LIAATAMVIGGLFGFLSQVIGDLLTKESQLAEQEQ
jgi:hypothetical protein